MKKTALSLLLCGLMLAAAACAPGEGSPASSPDAGANSPAANAANSAAPAGDTPNTAKAPENLNLEGFPIVKEPITLRVMGRKSPIQGEWKDLSFWKNLSEKSGIQFEFNTPLADGYEEKKNLAFAGDDLPDVFIGGSITINDELNYGLKQQLIVPIDELIAQYAPNIQSMFEKHPDWKNSVTAPDGHIYSFMQDAVGFGMYRYEWINQEWLDTLGLTVPKTIDELHNVLKQFKEKDPNGNQKADEIPLSFTNDSYDYTRSTLLSAFGYLSGGIEFVDDQAVYPPITDGYKEYLKFMHQLWTEGLIDPDAFSQTSQQETAKGNAGQLGSFSTIGEFLVVGTERADDYVVMQPLTSSLNQKQMAFMTSPINTGMAAITHVNPYPEATTRLLDWFYTEEGALSVIFGKEGTDFTRIEGGGIDFLVPEGMNKEEYRGGKVTPDAGTGLPRYSAPAQAIIISGDYQKSNPLDFKINSQVEQNIVPFAVCRTPKLYFTIEEQDRISQSSVDIDTYLKQIEARFIVGDADIETEWENHVNTLKAMGVEDALKINADAYTRWNQP